MLNWFKRIFRLLPALGVATGMLPAADAAMSANAAKQVDQILAQAYPSNQPGAAVLIATNDRVLLRKGYGLSDLEHGTRMRPDREFRIASISKQFTAVAVLQLVAAGRLHLDDEAAAYAPDFFAQLPANHITIRQLLAHTSGLKNYSDLAEFRDQPTRTVAVEDLLQMASRRGLQFEPGTAWEYCNTGYALLGLIVERVSGIPFATYLESRVIRPAGLSHTFVGSATTGNAPGIVGYIPTIGQPGKFERAVTLNLSQAFGAGGLVSCVDDLWIWDRAVRDGKVLPAALVREAQTPAVISSGGVLRATRPTSAIQTNFGDQERVAPYGFGWELQTMSHHATIGHGGTLSGYRSFECEAPDLGLYVAILCNCDRPKSDPAQVAAKIIAALERG